MMKYEALKEDREVFFNFVKVIFRVNRQKEEIQEEVKERKIEVLRLLDAGFRKCEIIQILQITRNQLNYCLMH